MLPDAATILVFAVRARENVSVAKAEDSASFMADCLDARSAGEVEACLGIRTKVAEGISHVYLPVRWAEVQSGVGRYDWEFTDAAVALAKSQGIRPILVLWTVPLWASSQQPKWDRDSSYAASTYPLAFAEFGQAVAERYRGRVNHYQLDRFANGAVPGSPFGVHPVRYGQMARAVGPAVRSVAENAILISAPLVPVTTPRAEWDDAKSWLRRLGDTGAWQELDALSFQNASRQNTGSSADSPPEDLPAYLSGSRHWYVQPTELDDLSQVEPLLAGEIRLRPARLLSGWHSAELEIAGAALILIVCLSLLVALYSQSSRTWQPGQVAASSGRGPVGAVPWCVLLGVALLACFLARNWLIGAGALLLLAWLSFQRPGYSMLLAVALLPFQQVHADFHSPFLLQSFSLSPSHVMAGVLSPLLLPLGPRQPAAGTAGAFPAFLLGGWFILLLAGEAGSSPFDFESWILRGFFPGWLTLIAWRLGFAGNNIRRGIEALAAGSALFASVGLAQWAWLQAGGTADSIRLAGLSYSPNHAAMTLLRGLWLSAVCIFLAERRGHRNAWTAGAALTGAALLLTLSRGALALGLTGGLIALGTTACYGRGRRSLLLLTLVGLGSVAVAAALLLASAPGEVLPRILDFRPWLARLHIWEQSLRMASFQAWLGTGTDGYFRLSATMLAGSPLVSPDLSHPHNVWIESYFRWGVAGLLWTVGLAGLALWQRTRSDASVEIRWLLGGAASAVAAGFLHAQVDAFWHWPEIAAFNLLLLLCLTSPKDGVSSSADTGNAGEIAAPSRLTAVAN